LPRQSRTETNPISGFACAVSSIEKAHLQHKMPGRTGKSRNAINEFWGDIETPIGRMTAIVNGDGAPVRLDFGGDTRADTDWQSSDRLIREDGAVARVDAQIAAHFRRELQVFDLPIATTGNQSDCSI